MPVRWSITFFVLAFAATAECVFHLVWGMPLLKTLPALLLTWAAFAHTRPRFGWWVMFGVACGAVGDFSLAGGQRSWFLIGLCAFLIGHVAYGVAFRKNLRFSSGRGLLVAVVWLGMGLLTAASVWRVMHRGSPQLAGPMIVYACVMGGMMLIAVLHESTSRLIAAGAVLFIISDAHIAANHMLLDHSNLALALSGYATYYGAQYLIVAGAANETRDTSSPPRAEIQPSPGA